MTFDHPTPAAVSELLRRELEAAESDGSERAGGNGVTEAVSEEQSEKDPLAPVLERIEQLSVAPPMPPVSLGTRVKTSPWLRGLVPRGMLVERAGRKGEAIWERSAHDREIATAAMETVVAGTTRAKDLEELARQHLSERDMDRAIFWQPWSAEIEEGSAKIVAEALAAGRGVIFSSCHLGPYYCLEQAAPFADRVTYLVPGAWFFEKPSADPWGRRLARWRKGMKSRVVPADGSYPVIQELLERMNPVFIFFDMPGPRETLFLGKPAMLAEGTAQLAMATDSLVVPLRARRVEHDVWVDAEMPLDPREFTGVDELHKALAAQHERWILENPAAMESPRSIGWGDAATAEAWNQPEPAAATSSQVEEAMSEGEPV